MKLFRDAGKLGITVLCIVDEQSREPAENPGPYHHLR